MYKQAHMHTHTHTENKVYKTQSLSETEKKREIYVYCVYHMCTFSKTDSTVTALMWCFRLVVWC